MWEGKKTNVKKGKWREGQGRGVKVMKERSRKQPNIYNREKGRKWEGKGKEERK